MKPASEKLILYKKSITSYLLSGYFLFVLIVYMMQETVTRAKVLSVLFFLMIWLLIVLFSLLEISWVKDFSHKYSGWTKGSILLLAPFASFLMIETIVSNYNLKMFQTYSLYNVIWYIVIFYLLYALIRNSRLTVMIGTMLCYLAGVINYLVFLFRGNPILPSDLFAWQTGMSVASNYELSFTSGFLRATIIMFFVIAMANKLDKSEKKITLRNRCLVISTFIVFATVVFHMFFGTDLINKKIRVLDFFAPKYTYSDYGTVFGFVANVKAMETEEPVGYSVEKVRAALSVPSEDEEVMSVTGNKPNIIVIMNEAYSDLSMLGDYETSNDYNPYTKSLSVNTTRGTLYVSVFGGATSDTEYEFLTGNSMAVLPKNCVPYQQYILGPTESLAATLKAQGYYNIAIHPYKASGYKRDMVYPLLGFDEFKSIDDFSNPELIRSYVSDLESYTKIIEEYEKKGKDNPVFIFNVTMQNHGGYSSERIFSDEDTVELTKNPGHKAAEQYLSLLRETDKSFQVLVDYFSVQEENTIILIFGDHQPVAYSSFYDEMQDEEKVNRLKYKVPFLLWANYDIEEDNVDKISANYLSSYLLQTAGLNGTAYNDYLMSLYQEIPVINALFYIDKNENLYSLADTSDNTELIMEYRYVGYNNALDKNGKLKEYYNYNK